jgi:hypothetical protein
VLAADEQACAGARACVWSPKRKPRRGTVTAIEAIVRQDDRGPSKGATEGGPPLLLPDA